MANLIYEELHLFVFLGNLIAMDFHLSENPTHFFPIDKNIVLSFSISCMVYSSRGEDDKFFSDGMNILTRLGFFNLVKNHTFQSHI